MASEPTGGDQQMDVAGDNDWTPPTEAELKIIQARKERSDKISKLMGDYLLKGYRMLATTCPVCGTILLRDRQQTDYCVACNELDTEHAKDDPALSAEAARSQVREQELIRSASTSSHDQPQLHHVLTSSSGAETPTPPLMPSISGIYSTGTMQSSGIPIGAAAHRVQLAHVSVPPHNQQATVLPQASGPPLTTMLQQAQVVPAPIYSNAPAMNPSNQGLTDEAAPDGNGHTRIGSVVQHSLDSVLDKLTWASEELKLSNSVETSTQLCRLIQACADAADSLKHLTVN